MDLGSAAMAAKLKWLYYRSFKSFSNIFVAKEEEMEIGHPTNVRHVAHIGWDNSSNGEPSWIHDFNSNHDVLTPNSTLPFHGFDRPVGFQSATELFNTVPSNKELQTESKKQKRKKIFPSSSNSCCPWTPRSSTGANNILRCLQN